MEAVVSLIILGMIAAIAAPYIPHTVSSMQYKAAIREMVYSLRAARSSAVTRQREHAVNLDLENGRYWLEKSENAKSLPSNAHIKLITAGSQQVTDYIGAIRFFPDGSSTGGQIIIANEDSKFTIDVNWLTGRVSILD